jgi:hypothetical protein
MTDDYTEPGGNNYADDTPEKLLLRAHFRSRLAARNMRVFRHYWLGVELRAFRRMASRRENSAGPLWLLNYEKWEWDAERRGPFPYDTYEYFWVSSCLYQDWCECCSSSTRDSDTDTKFLSCRKAGKVDVNGNPLLP